MRFVLIALALILVLFTHVQAVEDEDYLGMIDLGGTMTGANYSEYTPAFAEFMSAGPLERNFSAYPPYLGSFLDPPLVAMTINYSRYTPAFAEFMDAGHLERNFSAYPPYLGSFLDLPLEAVAINYSKYTPTVAEFIPDFVSKEYLLKRL